MQPKSAWALLAATLASIAAIVILARYSTDVGVAPPPKPLGALEVRAEEIVEGAGYLDPPADRASWFERNYDFLLYKARHLPTSIARQNLAHPELGVLTFFYRQSPQPLASSTADYFRISFLDPPHEVSGMITVVLDDSGRLIGLAAVPPQVQPSATTAPEPNWSQLLADTGLDSAGLTSEQPIWLSPMGFDRQFGWRGFYPEDPTTEIHISAASYRGKPVYFHVIGPWAHPWRMPAPPKPRTFVVRDTTFVIGGFATLIGAALIARRNLRLGRGDRRGGFRVSAFVFSIAMISGLLVTHHVPEMGAEFELVVRLVSVSLFGAAMVWVYYLALEPFVRRQWPELLISWTRLLSGKFGDPQIGRDLVVGICLGAIIALDSHIANALPAWFNIAGQTTIPNTPLTFGSPQDVLGFMLACLLAGLFPAFAVTFTLFVTRFLLRNYWLSVLTTGILLLITNLGGENFLLETPFVIVTTIVMMFVLLRLGIFALAVTFFTLTLLTSFPITFDLSRWYAPHSFFRFVVLLALLLYGLRVATGNKPLLPE